MRRQSIGLVSWLVLLFIIPLSGSAKEKISVFVSIIPQKFFVQQIAGDYVSVAEMVQPGASPATYEPKPRQMADLSRAIAYFAIGVPFESVWLDRIAQSNSKMRIVHTDQGIKKRAMSTNHQHDDGNLEEHAPDDGHIQRSAGLDPHIWLSPPLVRNQARIIMETLVDLDLEHMDEYRLNYDQFTQRINELDNDLRATFLDKKGAQFMVFHPSWGYFADAYGLRQIAIEVEGKGPKPAIVSELIHHAREEGIKVIFAQPQFSTKSAKLISRSIEGEVILADPLAEDWLNNMRMVSSKFHRALK